jgi:hypothetical protein
VVHGVPTQGFWVPSRGSRGETEVTTNHRNGISGKHERRFTGFDDKIIARCMPRGLTVREIQAVLDEAYAVEVSPDLISTVTGAVVAAEVTAWQGRPLSQLSRGVFRSSGSRWRPRSARSTRSLENRTDRGFPASTRINVFNWKKGENRR